MAKKTTKSSKISTPAASAKPAAASTVTAVRNSAIPPKSAVKKLAPTFDQISRRAYEISQSSQCGSQDDNWFRAERELRGV